MGSFLQIRFLPKVRFSRRNFHHLSPASAYYRKTNLLCPSCSFTNTNSTRCFSEAILRSDFVAFVSDQLTQNDVVYAVQEKLITFHDISGLPWWAVIVSSTITIRALLFPFAVHQQHVIAKMRNVQQEMDTVVTPKISEATAELAKKCKWDEKTAEVNYHSTEYDARQELYEKHKCKPRKVLILASIQAPVWITMSGALYNINSMLPIRDAVATQVFLDLKTSSIFGDLTAVDETYLLPLFIVFTNLIIVQLKDMSVTSDRNQLRTVGFILWRGFSIGSFPFGMYAPKCMTLYWLTSSLVGLLQNIIFVHPKTRGWLRIAPTDAMKEDPFARLKGKLKSFYYFFRY